jgi:hypothetical protein
VRPFDLARHATLHRGIEALVLPDSGHMTFVDQLFLQAVNDFVNGRS